MKPNKHVAQARLAACRKQPAMTSAILSLVPVEKPGLGTCCVDQHWRMYFDEIFMASVSPDEAAGVIIHETMHLVLRHAPRAQQIAPPEHRGMGGICNVATDCAINTILKAQGIALPKGAIYPEQFNLPEGKSFEFYYHELTKEMDSAQEQDKQSRGRPQSAMGGDQSKADGGKSSEGDQQSDDAGTSVGTDNAAGGEPAPGTDGGDVSPHAAPGTSGSCSDGQPRPWEDPAPGQDNAPPGLTESEQRQIIQEVAEKIEKATGAGKGNALSQWAEGILRPKVDPKVLLQHALRKAVDEISGAGGIFTYRRASRRSYPGGLLRPREMQPVPRITALLDTSGSMSREDFGWSIGLIDKVLNSFRLRDGIRVLCGDVEVHHAATIFDPKQIELHGGGGTDVGAMITQAYESAPVKERPSLILALTDGFTPWSQTPIPCKVIACLTHKSEMRRVPKWIQVIYIGRETD